MIISSIRTSYEKWPLESWVPMLLAATVFAVPLSSSLKSILMPLALFSIVLTPSYRRDLSATLYRPWCRAALLLFFMALFACVWSPATFNEKILVIGKYSKLLYLPILVVGFKEPSARRLGTHAFLASMGIICALSMMKAIGLLHFSGTAPDMVFRNHIMLGHMMAFAAYLSALFLMQHRGWSRLFYAILFTMFSYQLFFINSGRTGYVIYLLLMGLLMVQVLPWRKAVIAGLLGGVVVALSYVNSNVMHQRVDEALSNWQHYQQNKDTPIGQRMQFHEFAKNLYQHHPWLGNGTASFTYFFRVQKPVASWVETLLEPHSQYWLVAAEFGSFGVILLLFFFGSLLWASFRLESMRPIALALMLPFMLGNLSDSLLFYSGSGYFFLLLMALCLGEEKTKVEALKIIK